MLDISNSISGMISSFADKSASIWRYANEASDVMLGDLDTDIGKTEYKIVHQVDRVKLKHYISEKKGNQKMKVPLLVVYALINRETMLDLQPGRSVVNTFMDNGIDLYMIDWGYPTRKDKFLTIDDHVNHYMDEMVDYIRRERGVEKVNIMGICMGGTMCVMYSSLHPEKVNAIVTTVTPTNFDTDEGLLHCWIKNVNVDKVVDAFGNMPADIMNLGFLLLNPARLMIDKYKTFASNMKDKTYVENFLKMEKWIFESPDVPGETFRQFIKDCYQENLLIQNKMEIGGKRIDLKQVTMPLLNIYAQYDHLVPPDACNRLTKAVGSSDVKDICLKTGHIGIYVSSKTQKQFAPAICDWLRERDGQEKKNVE